MVIERTAESAPGGDKLVAGAVSAASTPFPFVQEASMRKASLILGVLGLSALSLPGPLAAEGGYCPGIIYVPSIGVCAYTGHGPCWACEYACGGTPQPYVWAMC